MPLDHARSTPQNRALVTSEHPQFRKCRKLEHEQPRQDLWIQSSSYYTNAFHSLNDKNYKWEIGNQTDPLLEAQRTEAQTMLMPCIKQLKANEQKFINCELLDMSHEEIAKECGCGTSEVGIRLERIHNKMGKMLNKFVQKDEEE